ncbi:MAG: polymer-forming cytoskeletal protein [Lentisphaerae bacterium]|nr:polymer-forming cytoskeletal protein [Lentisphaerota bacterium]
MENNSQQTARTVIGQDVEVVGSIKCGGAIQIDGKLNGDLTCTGNATIGAGAVIKGNISVNGISVLGTVTGNISAKDKIELKASANVNGDIRAKRMSVEDGVTFVGKSEVNPSGAAYRSESKQAEAQQQEQPETGDESRPKAGGFFGKK